VCHLQPSRPPKPRGFFSKRRRHRHYNRCKHFLYGLHMIIFPNDTPLEQLPLSPLEIYQYASDLIAQNCHKMLHMLWATIDLSFNVNFQSFIESITPLDDFLLQQCLSTLQLF
jgi:hypothetical protein